MSSLRPDLASIIYPDPQALSRIDHLDPDPDGFFGTDDFDRLPDSILLLIFNRIGDVKDLGRCCLVSRRFQSIVPQVDNVVVRVDCVIPDDDCSAGGGGAAAPEKSRGPFSTLLRLVLAGVVKPLQSLSQLLGPKRGGGSAGDDGGDLAAPSHRSPTHVLRNFSELRRLRIELPTGELGVEDGVLLKWRADFGSTLDNCVILGASSVVHGNGATSGQAEDDGNIPESFYTNGGLKLRVVWTISSLIAASARHYLLQPIISEHKTLDSLVLTDYDRQGLLCMNRDQLEELRVKPLSASSAAKRTLVPALNMRLWYAPHLELPGGIVLKGATLVAIQPSERSTTGNKGEVCEVCDGSWVSSAFEEPYGTAARMLVKRRTYSLEMNSF